MDPSVREAQEKRMAAIAEAAKEDARRNLMEQGAAANPTGYAADFSNCMQKEKPLAFRLRRRMNASEEKYNKTARALNILERHPELEELLWLLRSGLV